MTTSSGGFASEEKPTLLIRAKKLFQSIQASREKKSSVTTPLNQYTVLPKLLDHIEKQGEQIPFFEKIELSRGLCNGLSAYYLYSCVNKRKNQFFTLLAGALAETSDTLQLDKLNNYTRWLHRPDKYLTGVVQSNFSGIINYIKADEEPQIVPLSGITYPFNEEEFVTAMSKLAASGQMITLQSLGHAMAIFVDGDEYCFFDPDFNCDDEIRFKNLRDLYVWLVLESVSYDFEKLAKNHPNHVTISMNFHRSSEQKENTSVKPAILIADFLKNDSEGLMRGMETTGNPLFLACAANQPQIVEAMLHQNAKDLLEVKEPNSDMTSLLVSCATGNAECVSLLLLARANIDATAGGKSSALHKAIDSQDSKTVDILLEKKANIYLKTSLGTPLMYASQSGNIDIFKSLHKKHLEQKGNVNFIEIQKSLLFSAVENSHDDIVLFLLENKADPNLASTSSASSVTPLQIAIEKGNLRIIQSLLTAHATPEYCSPRPIILAASSKNVDVVKFFIEKMMNEEKHSESEFQITINEACAAALSFDDFRTVEYLMKTHKALSQGNMWISYNKLDSHPQIFPLLKFGLSSEQITHLTNYDLISRNSLATWAFANAKDENKEHKLSIREECANLIMDKIKKNPYQLFLTQATLKMNALYNELDSELNSLAKKINKSYQVTRFYHQKNYDRKLDKMHGLVRLIRLLINDSVPMSDALAIVKRENPMFLEGNYSKRVRNFVSWLTSENNKFESSFKSQYDVPSRKR